MDARSQGSVGAGQRETTIKKSVTLRRSLVEQIDEVAGERGFSAFIDAAAEHWLALLNAQEIVDDHERRVGRLPEDTLEEARRMWHGE